MSALGFPMGGLEKSLHSSDGCAGRCRSVGEKDYHLSEWIEWMQEENSRTPELLQIELRVFAEAVKSLDSQWRACKRNGSPSP